MITADDTAELLPILTPDEWHGWVVHYYAQHYPDGTTARLASTLTSAERRGFDMRAAYVEMMQGFIKSWNQE